jgi:hypothetical protein
MKLKCTPILRPFFAALANPGLGLPHAKHEVELMIAGAKPTIIAGLPLRGDHKTLQPLIDSGAIVKIDEHKADITINLLYRPEIETIVQRVIPIYEKMYSDQPVTLDESLLLTDFRNVHGKEMQPSISIQRNKALDRDTLETNLLLDGIIEGTRPVRFGKDLVAAPKKIKDALDAGIIKTSSFTEPNLMAVFAQKSCQDMGQELFARYYNNDKGYLPMRGKDSTKRIGELLGYTENDTAYFTGEKYQSRVAQWILQKTADLRRDARAQLMLYDREFE